VGTTLDSALKERLRAVLDRQPVTEGELRKLAEEGRACALIIGGQLERSERRLAELSSDPVSSLVEVAEALRAVNELRPDLEELEDLLDGLTRRAREFRVSWLSDPVAGGIRPTKEEE
jgi:sirohydrochlorin ferrochelatase